jgi:hypothetical protein
MTELFYWVYVNGRWSLHGATGYLDTVAKWTHAGCSVLVLPSTFTHRARRLADDQAVFLRYREPGSPALPMSETDDITREHVRKVLEQLLKALRIFDEAIVQLTEILSRMSHS